MEDFKKVKEKVLNYSQVLIKFQQTQKLEVKTLDMMQVMIGIKRCCDEHGMPNDINLLYHNIIKEYISQIVIPMVQRNKGESSSFLRDYKQQWDKFTEFTFLVRRTFEHLDRKFTREKGQMTLVFAAHSFFKAMVFEPLQANLRSSILCEIEKDRNKDIVEKTDI